MEETKTIITCKDRSLVRCSDCRDRFNCPVCLPGSKKSPEMIKALDDISTNLFSRARTESLANSDCVCCGEPAIEFSDAISKREYAISGMCQVCQDSVFGGN